VSPVEERVLKAARAMGDAIKAEADAKDAFAKAWQDPVNGSKPLLEIEKMVGATPGEIRDRERAMRDTRKELTAAAIAYADFERETERIEQAVRDAVLDLLRERAAPVARDEVFAAACHASDESPEVLTILSLAYRIVHQLEADDVIRHAGREFFILGNTDPEAAWDAAE
jgi:hypothetical protein